MNYEKKVATLIIAVCFTITMIVPAFAVPTLEYWYSDENRVAYMPYDGSYYIYNHSNNSVFSSYFYAAVSRASSQWNNTLPLSISETSFNYALSYVHGGTRDQLLDNFPTLSESTTGQTLIWWTDSTSATYNGSTRTVYTLNANNRMCVVERSGSTENNYKNTATHEMGHLFGWIGHSSSRSDVMYPSLTSIITLTSRDKNHLKQIYDLFY